MVEAAYIGKTYRQIAHRLRIQRGPGRGDKVSERPRNKAGRYLDEENPILLMFDEHDQVDVPALLKLGAIAPYQPYQPPKAAKGKEASE